MQLRRLFVVLFALICAGAALVNAPGHPFGAKSVAIADTPPPIPTPTPTPTPGPAPAQFPASQVLLVLAMASDVPTSAKIAVEVTDQVQQRLRAPYPPPFARKLVPLATWGLSDYVTACSQSIPSKMAADAKTSLMPLPPALIILPPFVQSAVNNYFLGTRSWTEVKFSAALFTCASSGAVTWVWSSDVYDNIGSINNFTLFGVAAAFAGVNAINNKSASNTTATTITNPGPTAIPAGSSATPGPAYTSQILTTVASGQNQNSPNGVIVGSAILQAFGTNLPSIGSTSTDRQFTVAVAKAVNALVKDLMNNASFFNALNP